jgi:hypothetical protein
MDWTSVAKKIEALSNPLTEEEIKHVEILEKKLYKRINNLIESNPDEIKKQLESSSEIVLYQIHYIESTTKADITQQNQASKKICDLLCNKKSSIIKFLGKKLPSGYSVGITKTSSLESGDYSIVQKFIVILSLRLSF